ncbi:Glutaredoxin [Nitrosomonas cryotolerans]|uniref:Methylamine utilization protein MauE n=1 Tax=Nitrosomonas cryotolerans ATCC 49181 TaxID=1131553 RepID=A0A1N6G0T2_9PROT|nr:glutaredoxin [Nitrosomonas cryotolerans]SFQ11950.1 Glutaredoxin [Nitrosomonas cryotolerans]SIO01165.1 Glutaredoxin [Nitrosomonas cryotolerans ATCC 49181]
MDKKISNEVFRKETCPWGKKAIKLLGDKGVDFHDHIFKSTEDEEDFKTKWRVDTTPQIFLNGERIGGYTKLASYYDVQADNDLAETSYIPIIAVFSVTLLMAIFSQNIMYSFMGYSLCLLACLKLMDLDSFVKGFTRYDLITKIFPFYGKIYPFAELIVGLGFLAPQYLFITGWLALFVGTAGGISIFKAVYIDKADLSCACIGGNSTVPLGIVSFSENAMMTFMGAWVLFA